MTTSLPFVLLGLLATSQIRPLPSHQTPARPVDPGVVARINGEPVTAVRLAVAVDSLLPSTSVHGTLKERTREQIVERALEKLIAEELWVQEARRLGLTVTRAEVDAGLARARARYRGPGTFEEARRRSGARLSDVRASIARTLIVEKAYARLVTARCAATAESAAEFYAANPDRFVTPLRRRVSIITIGVDAAATPAQRGAAREKTQELERRIRNGAPFADLAREYSTDPTKAKGGDLGLVHRGQLLEEFEAALDRLRPGELSGIVQSIYGFHLLRLVTNEAPARRRFEEVREQLVRDLTRSRCEAREAEATSTLRRRARVEVFSGAAHRASATQD